MINEYNNQNNLISKRIKKLKSITTFYSKYIHDFINWLVNVVNFKINERKIIKEKILNIILMYKNNVLFDLNDKDNSLMIFICNINSSRFIKNNHILIKSIDLLKKKYYQFKNNKYKYSIFKNNKYWSKIIVTTSLRLKKNKEFFYIYLPFMCSLLNVIIKKNKNMLVFLKHLLKKNELKLFIHLVLKLFKKCTYQILKIYKELYEERKSLIDSILYTDKYLEYFGHFQTVKTIYNFLTYLNKNDSSFLFCYENRNIYLETINYYINEIVNIGETYVSNDSFYELNNIMFSLSDYIFKNNIDSLIMIYSVEFITFEKENWIKYISFMDHLKFINLNFNVSEHYLKKSSIESMELIIKSNIKLYSDLDDKFIDPLTHTFIEEPVLQIIILL